MLQFHVISQPYHSSFKTTSYYQWEQHKKRKIRVSTREQQYHILYISSETDSGGMLKKRKKIWWQLFEKRAGGVVVWKFLASIWSLLALMWLNHGNQEINQRLSHIPAMMHHQLMISASAKPTLTPLLSS